MKLEQLLPRKAYGMKSKEHFTLHGMQSLAEDGLPLREIDKEVPVHFSSAQKLEWLRSQSVDQGAEFLSPFGARKLTYADTTASGRSLHFIERFIAKKVLPYYGNSHTSDSYVGRRITKMVNEGSRYVKSCLGGGPDDVIIFCGSGCTAAIKRLQDVMGISVAPNIRERVLKCLAVEERWVVFVGPYEHHSNLLSWRQSLAEVVEIGLKDGEIDIDDLKQKLELYKFAGRPMMGSFSACSNVTGIYSDTRKIAYLFHECGGFVCFDFAASGPYQEINFKSGEMDGYDAIFLSPHKFAGGPGTPGVLLINRSLYLLASLPPSTCGGGTVDYVNGLDEKDTLYVENIEERENAGTPQIIQIIRAAMAFWVKEYMGYELIQKQEEIFAGKSIEQMSRSKLIWVLGSVTANRQAILSFVIRSTEPIIDKGEDGEKIGKPLHGPFVAVLLNDLFGIQARGGCACAGPYGHALLGVSNEQSRAIRSAIEQGYNGVKPGWTRISFPYYMSVEEFEFIMAAVEFIALYGQRFLRLYTFDLKTGCWSFEKKMKFGHLQQQGKTGGKPPSSGNDLNNCFTTYLETAKKIALQLPEFPPLRKLPSDVDTDVLHFRV